MVDFDELTTASLASGVTHLALFSFAMSAPAAFALAVSAHTARIRAILLVGTTLASIDGEPMFAFNAVSQRLATLDGLRQLCPQCIYEGVRTNAKSRRASQGIFTNCDAGINSVSSNVFKSFRRETSNEWFEISCGSCVFPDSERTLKWHHRPHSNWKHFVALPGVERSDDMSDSVYTYVKSSVDDFLLEPPDSDFQRGYLAALLGVAEKALGLHLGKSPFMEAQKLCSTAGAMNWLQREISHRKRDVENLKREL